MRGGLLGSLPALYLALKFLIYFALSVSPFLLHCLFYIYSLY
jgi:hypothetical protein